MSLAARPVQDLLIGRPRAAETPRVSQSAWAMALRSRRVLVGGAIVLAITLVCVATLPWTLWEEKNDKGQSIHPPLYARQYSPRQPPQRRPGPLAWFGYDALGRSVLARCLVGGTISLAVGLAAAAIAVVLGVSVGLVAGYRGGWVDSALMRLVDILYGLPYILLVILFKIGFEPQLSALALRFGLDQESANRTANLVVMFSAIGLVSWLTMARVVRGQVLSLRAQPFIEACRAMGLPRRRIFIRHILPNLVGPITVYATLTVPQAILQESFLSFLGVGIKPPLPTWGSLAKDAVEALSPMEFYWWLLIFPCVLLMVTLLSLNFLGDGLRDVFDPKREQAKI